MIIKLSILTIVLLFSFQTFFAQTEKQIAAIRTEVAAIEKGATNYTRKINNVEDISLEGTEAIYFTEKTSLKKIISKMYGETFNATGEFYYRDGQLIFAFLKHSKYDMQIGMDKPPKVVSVEEQRFYFDDDKLIRLLVGKKELKSGSERYDELKNSILDISSKLKKSHGNLAR